MILAVCTDDDAGTLHVGQAQSAANPQVYGACHAVFATPVPALGVSENLFVIAHGAAVGDDGGPVIGDEHHAFWVNPADLWNNMQNIFPAGYYGNVYISACESADTPNGTCSFSELFSSVLRHHRPNAGTVYGQHGAVHGNIPLPTDQSWVPAV
ncbi:hypothetical protein [Kutzneria sp. NPDC051319]|uniref:hypothetical protein n=1 Tax=Kutzneria sp. NPDC051319 TaxID=3155047 RepID=UPI00344AEE4A